MEVFSFLGKIQSIKLVGGVARKTH